MLFDLNEAEGSAIVPALAALGHPAVRAAPGAFDRIDYLFWGRAPTCPQVWLAGAVTGAGASVSGNGLTAHAALWSVAGEAAEAEARAGRPAAPGPEGFGAHPAAAPAARHAEQELYERLVLGQWWDATRAGLAIGLGDLAAGLAGLGLGRSTGGASDRPLLAARVPVPQGEAVILASFDPGIDAGGFCVGTALRPTLPAALRAAALELVQSEFGLDLARTKRARLGEAGQRKGDRLTLRLADGVGQSVLRDHIAAGGGRPAEAHAPLPACRIEGLGQTAGGFRVRRARPAAPVPARPARRPFGDLDLFAAPA